MEIQPALAQTHDSEKTYEDIFLPCEHVEQYRPGGYHPVQLGDVFHDGKYRVLRKLGEGAFSTVWLTRDIPNQRYTALKILVSGGQTNPLHELRVLRFLQQADESGAKQHTVQLLDEFKHQGPNGIHHCLVFEPMGSNVNSMVLELPQFKPRTFDMEIRYPFWMAQRILKQSLEALAFLHEHGLAHGDFHPGNMLFCVDGIDNVPEDVLRQAINEGAESISPVQRLDGTQDPSAPKYLCVAQPLVPFTRIDDGFRIKLSDMGGAYFYHTPATAVLTPIGLRAPELILAQETSPSLDIWAFGCLVYELVVGLPLFCVPWSLNQDDDHLLQMSALLGPLPEKLYQQWKTSSRYYDFERRLYNCQIGGVPDGQDPLMLEQTSMEDEFDQAATAAGLSDEVASATKSLIRSVLQYDPNARPQPRDILKHPFFSVGCRDT